MEVAIPAWERIASAAVSSAVDKTSHNIFLLGGENITHAHFDAWVFSLPK
jgi:hypothetical protein